MKCLAVQQPWAWAICAGFKRVENRSWATPYRGPLAIVASSKQTEGKRAVTEFSRALPNETLTYSAIIGTVTLVDVVELSEKLESDPHATGPYCWLLENPKLFSTPIPTKGKLRLFDPTPEELTQIAHTNSEAGRQLSDPMFAEFARSVEPPQTELWLSRVESYWSENRWSDLERVSPRLIALDPPRAEGYFIRANLAFDRGLFEDAMADCNRAIGLEPKWGRAYFGRGDVYAELGDTVSARRDYDRALELDPALVDEIAQRHEENHAK